jgi:hypothetical protein
VTSRGSLPIRSQRRIQRRVQRAPIARPTAPRRQREVQNMAAPSSSFPMQHRTAGPQPFSLSSFLPANGNTANQSNVGSFFMTSRGSLPIRAQRRIQRRVQRAPIARPTAPRRQRGTSTPNRDWLSYGNIATVNCQHALLQMKTMNLAQLVQYAWNHWRAIMLYLRFVAM